MIPEWYQGCNYSFTPPPQKRYAGRQFGPSDPQGARSFWPCASCGERNGFCFWTKSWFYRGHVNVFRTEGLAVAVVVGKVKVVPGFSAHCLLNYIMWFWYTKIEDWTSQSTQLCKMFVELWECLQTSALGQRVNALNYFSTDFHTGYPYFIPIPFLCMVYVPRFTIIYHKNQPNAGKYTIHGSYGIYIYI